MSFLSSVSDYFGSSTKHANNASTHLSNADSSAYKGASSVFDGASSLFSSTTAVVGVTAWNSFDWIAGKIITTNSATHFANWGASLFGGAQATSYAAQATGFLAQSLVAYPIGSMATLMAVSVIATHPKETFEAVKKAGEAVYNFVEAGFELTEAVTEAALALGLQAVELLDSNVSNLFEDIEMTTFVNYSHEEVELSGLVEPLAGLPVSDMEV